MKCLEKDRTRRYETASGVAADIQRHLNTEPVEACPPSKLYEFQKTVRRYKVGFAAAAAIIIVLTIGILISTWQAAEARKARRDAETAKDNEQAQRIAAEEARAAAESERKRAETERARAEAGEKLAEDRLYAARMNLAQQAWNQGDLAQLKTPLRETATHPNRGFEWYFWQRQLHRDKFSLPPGWSTYFDNGRSILSEESDRMAVRSADTGEILRTLPGPSSQSLVELNGMLAGCISNDGQRRGFLGNDGLIRVLETTSGRELRSWPKGPPPDAALPTDEVWGLALSSDYRWMLISTHNNATGHLKNALTEVWDVEQGKRLFTRKGSIGLNPPFSSDLFSPDGRRFALFTNNFQNICVWEITSGRELLTLETKDIAGFMSGVMRIAFSPDSRRIVAGGADNGLAALKTWDAVSGRPLLTWPDHRGMIDYLAVSPDGERIASGNNFGIVKIWDAGNGTELLTLRTGNERSSNIKWSPDGRHLIAGAKVWDATAGQGPVTLPIPEGDQAVSSNGKVVLAVSGTSRTVSICDASSSAELHRFPVQEGEYPLTISSDGTRVAINSAEDHFVKIADAETGQTLFTLNVHADAPNAAAFTPDGSSVVTINDGSVKVWEASSGRELTALNLPTSSDWLAFSRDGRRFFTNGRNGRKIILWDANTFEKQNEIEGPGSVLLGGALFPDGRRLLVGGLDGVARVLDATSGQELLRLDLQEWAVYSVSVSADGLRVITFGNSAQVWEAASPLQVEKWASNKKTP